MAVAGHVLQAALDPSVRACLQAVCIILVEVVRALVLVAAMLRRGSSQEGSGKGGTRVQPLGAEQQPVPETRRRSQP